MYKSRFIFRFKMLFRLFFSISFQCGRLARRHHSVQHVQDSSIFPNNLKNKHSKKRRFCFVLFNFTRLCCRFSRFSRFNGCWEIISAFVRWSTFVHAIQSNYITLAHCYCNRRNNRKIINNLHLKHLSKCNQRGKADCKKQLPSRCPILGAFWRGTRVGCDRSFAKAHGL